MCWSRCHLLSNSDYLYFFGTTSFSSGADFLQQGQVPVSASSTSGGIALRSCSQFSTVRRDTPRSTPSAPVFSPRRWRMDCSRVPLIY